MNLPVMFGVFILMGYFNRETYIEWFKHQVLGKGLQKDWFDETIPASSVADAFSWIHSHVAYQPDLTLYHQAEYFAKASETLTRMAGDCDDQTILLASYMVHQGLDPIVVMAETRRGGHAFVVLDDIVYDPTSGEILSDTEYFKRYEVDPILWFTLNSFEERTIKNYEERA